MEINKEIIKNLPKGDVHNHLSLGVNRKSLEKYYSFSALRIPEYFNGLEGMIEYIDKEINKRMDTDKHVIKFMELAIADSIEDNVVLLEASIDINLVKYFNNGIEDLIEAVHLLKTMYDSPARTGIIV